MCGVNAGDMSVPRIVATALSLLFLVAAASAPVAAAESGSEWCFPTGGHALDIGTEGPGIAVTVHTSLFTNLGGRGALGVEAVGTAGEVDVVTLRTGVLFEGVGEAGAFLSDPLSRFSIPFRYEFRLPMFTPLGHGVDYETDRSPVSGVDASAC